VLPFKQEGVFRQDAYKNGRYQDVHFMAVLKQDYQAFLERQKARE
jgi:RimJ/RimL family protein N-acetyltransferase